MSPGKLKKTRMLIQVPGSAPRRAGTREPRKMKRGTEEEMNILQKAESFLSSISQITTKTAGGSEAREEGGSKEV